MRISIPIEPVGQMRARHGTFRTKAGKTISKTYKHETQAARENTLAAFLARHVPQDPLEGPLAVRVTVVFSIPQSWPKRRQTEAREGLTRPTKKPDLDNIIKHIKDVMTEMRFWKDDAQVVEYLPGTAKIYGERPCIEVEVLPAAIPGRPE